MSNRRIRRRDTLLMKKPAGPSRTSGEESADSGVWTSDVGLRHGAAEEDGGVLKRAETGEVDWRRCRLAKSGISRRWLRGKAAKVGRKCRNGSRIEKRVGKVEEDRRLCPERRDEDGGAWQGTGPTSEVGNGDEKV